MSTRQLELSQIGPGQYRGQFQGAGSGSYIVNLRYRGLGQNAKTRLTHSTVTIPFAPEFRDLSDNAPLLAEVSDISGGRILGSDPNRVNLFDYSGLKFPETQLPLIRPLMLIWLALFLLDVAVRRVALDVRAIARRIAAFRSARAERKGDATVERLRLTQQKLRKQLFTKPPDAGKRYEAGKEYEGELPVAKAVPQAMPPHKKETEKPAAEDVKADKDSSHIQRLLRAKHKASDRRRNDSEPNNG
jgi:hypothetical protein